jgi:hypothetical protein
MDPILVAAGLVVIAAVVGLARLSRRIQKKMAIDAEKHRAAMNERMEALFRASFPELQPHFHPRNVFEYAKARQARKASSGPFRWKKPPGFTLADVADVQLEGLRDKVRLLDAGGRKLTDFVLEEHAEGAVLRVGKGKFTVGLKGPEPRVRYWHPEREFKWTPTLWKMKSGVSDHELESSSSSSDTSSYDDGPRSSSFTSTTAAAAAGGGIVAAGGTFDGGGASAAWDDGAGSSSQSSGSDSSPDFGSVESGSSSSASTTY